MAGEAYFDFDLNFGNVSMPRRLRITQYGDQLPVFRAKLYNMGTAYGIPEGSTVNVRWKKPSGTAVYNPVTSFDGNTITYALDGQCLAVNGICEVCFEITSEGKKIQTPVFSVEVVKNPVQQDDIEDSPEFDALDKALQETIDAAKSETDKIVQAAGEQAQAGFDDVVERAKTEADKIASKSAEQAKQYASAASISANQSASSATRAEEAAKRAEAAAPVEGQVISVNGMGGIVQLNADKVPFDNTGTPFVSTTVQDAIEELLSIGGGGGAAISTITVTAPAGAVVTISQGGKSYTQTVGEDGAALTFRVLETGYWDVLAVLEGVQDTGSVNVAEAGGSYSITLDFAPYKAYIKVLGQDGATVNAAKGEKSVSGTISGGSVTLTVNEDGEWTVTAIYKDGIAQATTVNVLEEGETYTAEAKFCTLTVTAPAGSTVEIKNGVATLTGTADSGSVKFWLPNTGTWTVKATLNDQTANGSVDCAAYQDYTTELAYFSATIKATAVRGATVKAVLDDYSVSGEAGSDGTVTLTVTKTGSYTISATYSNALSNSKTVQVSQSDQQYTVSVEFITLTVTAPEGSSITVKNGATTLTATGGTVKFWLPRTGTWTATAELNGQTANSSVDCSVYQSYSVELAYIQRVLANNPWSTIMSVADADEGANWWAIGDTKPVPLNGKVGNLTLSNLTVDAFILGFNHNAAKEGAHLIHFALGKISGKMVALCDSQYDNYTSSGYFVMNGNSSNSGGWNASEMRKNILGNTGSPSSPRANSLMAALPADLRAVMKSVTKYTDNTGNGGNSSSAVTATTDYMWLLSEFEVQGSRTYANQFEKNSQAQYAYYKAGNSKVAYNHANNGSAVWWWLRSPYCYYGDYFCDTCADGSANRSYANCSAGVLAGFAA